MALRDLINDCEAILALVCQWLTGRQVVWDSQNEKGGSAVLHGNHRISYFSVLLAYVRVTL